MHIVKKAKTKIVWTVCQYYWGDSNVKYVSFHKTRKEARSFISNGKYFSYKDKFTGPHKNVVIVL